MSKLLIRSFLPQGEEIAALQKDISSHRLVHALLIQGDPGVGKKTLASLIAAALMCRSESGDLCGECEGCHLSSAGEHPDITYIEKGNPLTAETGKGRSTIPVEDIREVIRRCGRFGFEGGNRAVVIADAENMTVQAQNCLLKILEEPPQNTYFILTSSHPDQLLSTVKSRCRVLRLKPWNREYVLNILKGAGVSAELAEKAADLSAGSVGTALKLSASEEYWKIHDEVFRIFFQTRKRSDILSVSSAWKERKAEAPVLFEILEHYIFLLLNHRLHPSENPVDTRLFPPEWIRFSESAPLDQFAELLDQIREARKQLSFNVNFQSVFEQLLLFFIGVKDLWQK